MDMATMNTIPMERQNFRHQIDPELPQAEAVEKAIRLHRGLLRPSAALRGALPRGMLDLIKLASGNDDTWIGLSGQISSTRAVTEEAANCYLALLLSQQKLTDRQVLMLTPDASAADLREHKRALLKWLHPDRNTNKWQSAFFDRVSQAAKRLSNEAPTAKDIPSTIAVPLSRSTGVTRTKGRSRRPRSHQTLKRQVDVSALRRRLVRVSLLVAIMAMGLSFIYNHLSDTARPPVARTLATGGQLAP
jgi:hypothetical protein